MIAVAGTTKGYPKQVSESDGTVSDAAGEPAAGGVDHVDASIHSSPSSDSLSIDIPNHHEKADMLIARSTVSGISPYSVSYLVHSDCLKRNFVSKGTIP